MTDRLSLYNKALLMVGSRTLANLSENRESRRALDAIWDAGAIDHCLEQGYWNFAMRTVRLDATSEIEPEFGYQYAFAKPDDYIRTFAFCYDEYFQSPILRYADEAEYWFTDQDEIYVQYVANSEEYGNNMGAWPQSFQRYVEAYLAAAVAPRLTHNSTKIAELMELERRYFQDARTQDASNEPTKFKPIGSWAGARMSSYGSRNRHGRYR